MSTEKQRADWRTEVNPETPQPAPKPVPRGWRYNRRLGVLLLAAAVVLASLLGVSRGVRSQYRRVIEAYAEGTDGSGYGVAYYGRGMDERAANLCKLAGKSQYGGAFSSQIEAVEQARLAISSAGTAGMLYEAVSTLTDAVDALNDELKDGSLTDADEQLRQSEYQSFQDQLFKLRNVAVDYNEVARAYNDKVLGSFPAGAMKNMLHLPEAEEYR